MGIEFSSVREFAAALELVPSRTRAELRPKLLAAGQLIARKAQANASWSGRIPGAITVSQSITRGGGAVVRVDAAKAPHARPYEGRGSRGGFFRHPVFGNREVWVSQKTRPFLGPAAQSERDAAVALISEAVREATRNL